MNRWTFDNDKLFELVRIGRKRGTCSRNSDEEPMAKIGDVQEIYNSPDETIRIQITAVRLCRFCDIDDAWAKIEGEVDLSITHRQNIC